MNTPLIILTLALAIIDVTLSLTAPSTEPPSESVPPEEEADDLPFGPAPSDQY